MALKSTTRLVVALVVYLLITTLAFGSVATSVPQIPNTATVTYSTPAGSDSKQSNQVFIQELAAESLTLQQDGSQTVAAGVNVAFKHALTNTGNASSQITVDAQNASASAVPFTLSNLRIFQDSNNNGILDAGDALVTSPLSLSSGQSVVLFVSGDVPSNAVAGSKSSLVITAVTALQAVKVANTDTVTVAGSSVQIAKTASTANAHGGDVVTFTIAVTNTGATAALPKAITLDGVSQQAVVVRDRIPVNTSFNSLMNAGGTTLLYHFVSESNVDAYTASAPSDTSIIDAVAFTVPSLEAGSSITPKFSVTIHANAATQISNVADVDYVDGVPQHRSSSLVVIKLPDFNPQLAYYGPTYTQPTTVGMIGAPLYVQGNASACNLDPLKVETQMISIAAALSGDAETYNATETGPNTGIFRIQPNVPTRDASTSPVVKGDGVMEVLSNDKLTATLTCGGKAVATGIFIDPSGMVFNSKTNAPIAGAIVTLIDVAGSGNGGKPGQPAVVLEADGVTVAPSTVTTGTDGRFKFPSVKGSTYKYLVVPGNGYKVPSAVSPSQLPAGHNIDPTGSYLGSFIVSPATGTVLIDVPADPGPLAGLFVEKLGSKTYAQLGDFVDYTVQVNNNTGRALSSVQLVDTMPRGLRYVPHTARQDGKLLAEPTQVGGKYVFTLGDITAQQVVKVTYRAEIGPGVVNGRMYNAAQATSGSTTSNESRAMLTIEGGVFSNEGFLVGNVYTRCADDKGVTHTFGVPGAKVYIEDGTYSITDIDGKYSMYGIKAQTHVVKVDGFTLPHGAKFMALSARNASDGATIFLDMQFGEMRRADFSLVCTKNLQAEVEKRVAEQKKKDSPEIITATKSNFTADPGTLSAPTANKGAAASGVVNGTAQLNSFSIVDPMAKPTGGKVLYDAIKKSTDVAKPAVVNASAATAPVEADEKFDDVDSSLGFVNLRDEEVVGAPQINLWIKGPTGSDLHLLVNGRELESTRIGSKKTIADKNVTLLKYIGVDFKTGRNNLKLTTKDPFGNERSVSINVMVPDQVAAVLLDLPSKPLEADKYTTTRIVVKLSDKAGQQVKSDAVATVETTVGEWETKDIDPDSRGVQTKISNGMGTLELQPPDQPGIARIRVTVNGVTSEGMITYVPQLRPMTAAGIVDYQLNFQHNPSSAVQSVSGAEGFEEKLRLFSVEGDNVQFGSRTALYLKGKILGSNLLTLAYDSNRASGERMFRDIQPDQYYPIYGDSSTRGYDAQSTSKFYLRIDNGRSYLLYGDFMTSQSSDSSRSLTNYSRSLTGVQHHYQTDRTNVSSFATYDTFKQVVQEFAANGTSGPFEFSYTNGVENSEKVDVLTRDRNQPAVVLAVKTLTRFDDYEFEPFTGRLLLKAPLPSLDDHMNPYYIRVTYEVDNGGARFWTGGVDGDYKVTSKFSVGGIAIADSDPTDPNQLFGVRASYKVRHDAILTGEFADSNHDIEGNGTGYRLEYREEGKNLKTDLYFGRTSNQFQNQSSLLSQGRGEAGGKLTYVIGKDTQINGDFIRTEDVLTGGTEVGATFGIERQLMNRFRLRIDLRHAQTSLSPAGGTLIGAGASSVGPTDQTTISTSVTTKIKSLRNTEITVGYEQDVTDAEKHRFTVGATMLLGNKGKLYVRHEFLSSLGDVYALNNTQARMATVIGVDTDYFKKVHVFSEYRQHDELTNRDSETALGLRNMWQLNKHLAVSASFEQIHSFGNDSLALQVAPQGVASTSSIAVTGGFEYNSDQKWRAATRVEYRNSSTSDSYLASFAYGRQLTQRWTLLTRNIMMRDVAKAATAANRTQVRFQTGAAYRGSELSRWDLLSMFEYRIQSGTDLATSLEQRLGIFSTNLNYQPIHGFSFSGRYATKWNLDGTAGLNNSSFNQMFSWHMTKDVAKKWDVALMGSTLSNGNFSWNKQGIGTEIGYQLKQNLWLSTGYNFLGFNERDMPGGTDSRQGAFMRLRFKFDESILKGKERRQLKQQDETQSSSKDQGDGK